MFDLIHGNAFLIFVHLRNKIENADTFYQAECTRTHMNHKLFEKREIMSVPVLTGKKHSPPPCDWLASFPASVAHHATSHTHVQLASSCQGCGHLWSSRTGLGNDACRPDMKRPRSCWPLDWTRASHWQPEGRAIGSHCGRPPMAWLHLVVAYNFLEFLDQAAGLLQQEKHAHMYPNIGKFALTRNEFC